MKDFLTAKDISKLLRINYHNALKFIRFSGIQYIKLGNQYRVTKDAFIKFTHPVRGNKYIKFED